MWIRDSAGSLWPWQSVMAGLAARWGSSCSKFSKDRGQPHKVQGQQGSMAGERLMCHKHVRIHVSFASLQQGTAVYAMGASIECDSCCFNSSQPGVRILLSDMLTSMLLCCGRQQQSISHQFPSFTYRVRPYLTQQCRHS